MTERKIKPNETTKRNKKALRKQAKFNGIPEGIE
jgi:hypothetical protein